MTPTLLVLAAGMGSRYGGLKQMEAVGPHRQTIIDYSVFDALRAGFGKLVFVIRRDMEAAFRETVGTRFEKRIAVEYLFQELDQLPRGFTPPPGRTKPWGTAHAILMGAELIREPFAVINGDDFYGANSFRVLAEHMRGQAPDYAMVGFVLRNTLSDFGSVARGVCRVSPQNQLQTINEVVGIEKEGSGAKYTDTFGRIQALTGDEIVSMNIWGFTPSLFDHLRRHFTAFLIEQRGREKCEFFIPDVVNSLLRNSAERVRVLQTKDSWFGITHREDRQRVVEGLCQLVQQGAYPECLWP